jgi:hypothetical protein
MIPSSRDDDCRIRKLDARFPLPKYYSSPGKARGFHVGSLTRRRQGLGGSGEGANLRWAGTKGMKRRCN